MNIPIDILLDPDTAFRNIRKNPSFDQAMLWALGAWLGISISILLTFGATLSPWIFFIILVAGAVLMSLGIYIKSLFFQTLAGFMGGTGEHKALLAMFAYCLMPFYLLLPSAILFHGSAIIMPPVIIGLLSWSAILAMKAIKENNDFTVLRSFALLCAPVIFFLSVFMFLVFAATTMLALKLAMAMLKLSVLL